MCGPHRRFAPLLPHTLQRIPQAVGTVATQKVILQKNVQNLQRFNTASSRCCCNFTDKEGTWVLTDPFQYRRR